MDIISFPEPQRLVPPLLAALPAACASRRPSPAVLSIVAPILRHRLVHLTSTSISSSDRWIDLLCWNRDKAERLRNIAENSNFEPHPCSGEVEVGNVAFIDFKRFDPESLHTRIALPEWQLCAVYLWCSSDTHGNDWRLLELLPYEKGSLGDQEWFSSIEKADQDALHDSCSASIKNGQNDRPQTPSTEAAENNYWEQYVQTITSLKSLHNDGGLKEEYVKAADDDQDAQYIYGQSALDRDTPTEDGVQIEHRAGHRQLPALSKWRQDTPISEDTQPLPASRIRPTTLIPIAERWSWQSMEAGALENDENAGPETPNFENYGESAQKVRLHLVDSFKSLFKLAQGHGISREELLELVRAQIEDD